jgi:hypothetical protein
MPTYGKSRISLAKRAGQKRGWEQVKCVQYGQEVTKTVKTFLATYRPAGGTIRVVLVKEGDGWIPFFCTDPNATAEDILEAASDRTAHLACLRPLALSGTARGRSGREASPAATISTPPHLPPASAPCPRRGRAIGCTRSFS